MKRIAIVLLLFITSFSGYAQQLNSKKLDSLFQKLDENKKWMGSFAISVNGIPVYTKAIGYANIEKQAKSTPTAKYRIGSISKTFTATLIFKGIEANKLTLEDKLSSYFPTVKNAEKITINNLLNHRSGIFNFTNSPAYVSWDTQKKTNEEMVQIISAPNSDFEPGSKYAYSNSNYVLLGYILEKIYKKSLKDILNDQIIKPLGLKNTYLGDKIEIGNNEVYSYRLISNQWEKQRETDMSIPAGAGAVVSNPTDLNLFINSLFDGKLVSQQSLSKMKALTDRYGYGLVPFQFEQKEGFGHNGGIDAFTSMLFYFPEDKLSVSLISNGNAYENRKIFTAGLSVYYNKAFTIPSFTSISLTSADLDPYLGEYSGPNFPLKITISKKDNVLISQATGQSSFPLEPTEKNIFEFAAAGIVLEFNPTEKTMIVKQGAGKYVLTKP